MSRRASSFLVQVVNKAALSFASVVMLLAGSEARAGLFTVTNLVTNDQSANSAQIADPNLKNAWGISYTSSGSPFWVSANHSGLAALYRVNSATNATSQVPMVVSIPGDGSVTGQAFNPAVAAGAFNSDSFLFVNEDGTISGWRGSLGTNAEILQSPDSSNVYKGATVVGAGGHEYLLSANFRTGNIDVMKGDPSAPDLTGKFADPVLPSGYAPFNVQLLAGKVYVAYAVPGSGNDEQTGSGKGIVSVFDTQGNFLARVGAHGTLNAPWGLAIAPASFGALAGDLLVGNFGDGRINAFDLTTNTFVEQLAGQNGNPLEIGGLWGLTIGNDGEAGSSQDIYFSAGPNDEANGLFGVIAPVTATVTVPEPSTLVISSILFGMFGVPELRKRVRRNAKTA
jgi:uncharacterized protein (TIGR03118 family)